MAALQHPVGGLPLDGSTSRKSFAEVLATKSVVVPSPKDPYHHDLLKLGLHKGQPAAFFTEEQLNDLSGKYTWSLIGKFSKGYNKDNPKQGRPSLTALHQYFLSLDLRSEFSLGLLDNRHVIIHLSHEDDHLRLYTRMVWYIGSVTMRVFRWSPFFRVDKESPFVPVWIKLPRLPIMLFKKQTLFSLASLIGRPMRCDVATEQLKRPSVARIQVELDLLKPRPDHIWIGLGENDGFWQKIEYEFVPDYCQHYWHVGHSEALCHVHSPELKGVGSSKDPSQQVVPRPPQKQKQIYVAKSVQAKGVVAPTNLHESDGPFFVPDSNISPSTVAGPPLPTAADAQESQAGSKLPKIPVVDPPTDPLPSAPLPEDESDSDIEEVPNPEPVSDATLLENFSTSVTAARIAPGIQDDFQIGASDKLYSPTILGTRSVRPLQLAARPKDQILAELLDFGRSNLPPNPTGLHARKRGRPPKSKAIVPSLPHGMQTRSQASASQPSDE